MQTAPAEPAQIIDVVPEAQHQLPAARQPTAGALSVSDVGNLLSLAVEKGYDPDGLSKLMDLRDRMMAERAQTEAVSALAAMQSTIPPIPKTRAVRRNGRGDEPGEVMYHYAALEDCLHHLRPFLDQHGFVVRFNSSLEVEAVNDSIRQFQRAECIITHRGGHTFSAFHRTQIDANAKSQNVTQQGASAETYAKRRALMNAFGLAVTDEDDDGRGSRRREANEAPESDPNAPQAATREERKGGSGMVKVEEIQALAHRYCEGFLDLSRDEQKSKFAKWAWATAAVPEAKAFSVSGWSREAIRTCTMALDNQEAELFGDQK
jgi:hypothetical protein